MLEKGVILVFAFGYMGLLFAIARYGDKRAESGRSLISNPYIYTLSLAVYCTAWTFYGSVGMASRTGIRYLAVYIGPTLTASLGWVVLRKILRISKRNRITSIADFIASRYGKSALLAGVVTVIAVIGVIPYISVQIKAISTTYLIVSHYPDISNPGYLGNIPLFKDTALYVALLLALFAVLFGTRHLEATERHEGLVTAIAFESLVKLIAFTCVGLFVTYGLYDGFGDLFRKAAALPQISRHFTINLPAGTFSTWYAGIFLAMMAIICLPRQFQVTVVENVNEEHLKKAIWLFPLYLLAINIFVLPVAFGGILHFTGAAVDGDTFVLTLPMAEKQQALALLVFIGGLSAASGMVIVSSIALATMICNDLVMPVLLRLPSLGVVRRSDMTTLLLAIRRGSILVVLL
ncbi:MAG: histidine kinase, partial [Desulfosarcinaceae bacterium]